MFKKLICSTIIAAVITGSVSSFALVIDGFRVTEKTGHDPNVVYEYSISDVQHNNAICETPVRARANTVTESDCYLVTAKASTVGGAVTWYEESAEGYVTIKDGNTDVYHYTRAELHRNGSAFNVGYNLYGYGRVYGCTNFFRVDNNAKSTARVFYGY